MGLLFKNPAKQSQNQIGQIPGAVSPYFSPYIQAGQGAMGNLQQQYGNLMGNYGQLQGQYNKLMTNPESEMFDIGSQYHSSPGYNWELGQGEDAINNAAAAGGMLGSPEHQQEAGGLAENMANQNYQQYLNTALGLYHTGLRGAHDFYSQGLRGERGLNDMGYRASNEMASALAQSLMGQANAGAASAGFHNAHMGGLLGGALGLGKGISDYSDHNSMFYF